MHLPKPSVRRVLASILLVGALLLAPFLFSAGHPYLPPTPLPEVPLIDMHCHTAGLGAGGSGCFVSEKLRHSFKLGFYFRAFGVTEKEILRDGDAIVLDRLAARLAGSHHVGRAVVLAL